LVFIQEIVIFPECVLLGSTLTCLGCPLRFRSQEGKVNVGKTNLAILNISFFDLTPRVSGESPTERSLKVAKFDQCNGRIHVTCEMTCLRYQVRHHLFVADPRWFLRNCLRNNCLFLVVRKQRSYVIPAKQANHKHDNAYNGRCPGLHIDRDGRTVFGLCHFCFLHITSPG